MHGFDARDLLDCYARGVFPMADAREDASVFLIDAKGRFQSTIAYGEATDTAVGKLKRLIGG